MPRESTSLISFGLRVASASDVQRVRPWDDYQDVDHAHVYPRPARARSASVDPLRVKGGC